MGSFSIWHGLIVLVLLAFAVGIVIAAWKTSQRPSPLGIKGPVGFGGWLLLLAVGQTLAPLRSLDGLRQEIDAYSSIRSTYAVPNINLAEGTEVVLVLAMVVFSIVVAVLMYRKKTYFPTLFLWQWIFALVVSVGNLVVPALLMGIPLNEMMNTQAVGSILAVAIVGGLWVLYVFRSVRVRNTFVR